jgi:hypothetical protein
MTTIIQIGNSDDKLTQAQWALFYRRVDIAVRTRARQVYFSGASHPSVEWQNAAWIFEIGEEASSELYDYMKTLCEWFNQESIAWTEGSTILVAASNVKKDGVR